MMIDGYLLNTRVFRKVEDSKEQALKPLEKAGGVFDAWQIYDKTRHASPAARGVFRRDIINKCMDTVQAVANLLAAVGATQGEVDAAIKRMDEHNGDRGRL